MTMLALMGDVMLGRGINQVLPDMPPAEPWGDVLPLLQAADLRLTNLECTLTRHQQPWHRTPKVFHFRGDPKAVSVLQAAGIDVCSLANNHILDFEVEGLLETVDVLDQAGIQHSGAGADREAAMRPAFLAPRGNAADRVAVVAVTDNEPGWEAQPQQPGTHYLPASTVRPVMQHVETMVRRCRAGGAKTLVLSNHWGPNMVLRPTAPFQAFARAAVDRGFDLYFGHSAHVFQGIEVYHDRLILYDTGDFLDDYVVDPVLRNDWSCLVLADYDGGRLMHVELVPVVLTFARVHQAVGTEQQAILERVRDLSAALGTRLWAHQGRLVWERPLRASA
jgi:poly-gamma-glutamate synthesis protein (capsule biosynthesis protein)